MKTYRTYAFRRFKSELSNLSRMRWVFTYAQQYVRQQIASEGRRGDERLCVIFPVPGFDEKRLNISTEEFCSQTEQHEDHLNLLLLVKACASMEDYLGRIATIWAVMRGYCDPIDKPILDRRGKAIIQPATISSLESALSYHELLLGIKLGKKLRTVGDAYKLRCIAAHNGGVVDQDTLKLFPEMTDDLGKPIRLSWDRLHEYLNAIGRSCSDIDDALPSRGKCDSELRIILHGLLQTKDIGRLDEPRARQFLTRTFGFNNLPDRQRLDEILRSLR